MNYKRMLFRIAVAPGVVFGFVGALAQISWRVGYAKGVAWMVRFSGWAKKP